jgi:hypothetical protein
MLGKWDFRFSWWCCWRIESSGMWFYVICIYIHFINPSCNLSAQDMKHVTTLIQDCAAVMSYWTQITHNITWHWNTIIYTTPVQYKTTQCHITYDKTIQILYSLQGSSSLGVSWHFEGLYFLHIFRVFLKIWVLCDMMLCVLLGE